jgi:hypothetical protein
VVDVLAGPDGLPRNTARDIATTTPIFKGFLRFSVRCSGILNAIATLK